MSRYASFIIIVIGKQGITYLDRFHVSPDLMLTISNWGVSLKLPGDLPYENVKQTEAMSTRNNDKVVVAAPQARMMEVVSSDSWQRLSILK